MIRDPKEDAEWISVYLRNGTQFTKKDLPEDPYVVPGTVSFWYDDKLTTIPLDLVALVEIKEK